MVSNTKGAKSSSHRALVSSSGEVLWVGVFGVASTSSWKIEAVMGGILAAVKLIIPAGSDREASSMMARAAGDNLEGLYAIVEVSLVLLRLQCCRGDSTLRPDTRTSENLDSRRTADHRH